MAATFSSLSCASPSIALTKARTAQLLRSQDPLVNTPLLPPPHLRSARRHQRAACIKAMKNDQDGHRESSRRRAGLTGLLLPSVAAMLIGSTPFAPEARAEMSQTDYYQSLMESIKKAAQAPPVAAPTQAPPVSAAVAPVAEAPAETAPAPSEDISSFKSYFSSLTDTKPKEEAPEQPKPLTAAELRAKRVAEVAKREREEAERKREEAERKAAEQKAAQEAKAQAEARAAKEAADRAEKEAQQKAKEASEKLKSEREAQEKTAREAATAAASAAKSKKTHGYLPLFVAQFLFLALYAGGITLAFFLPDSVAKKLEGKTNELFERVGPLLEKAQPYVEKAVAAGNGLVKQAKPYVSKAAQEAVPLVNKAVEASKPLVSQAQAKAGEAISKIKEEQKSL